MARYIKEKKTNIFVHNKNRLRFASCFFIFLIIFSFIFSSCIKNNTREDGTISVLVFITGVIAGSPPYELMAEGANEFVQANPDIKVKIYEAGMNQAEWEQQLAEMVSTGDYDVVIGSNPSLPEICVNIAHRFPNVKFIITDAHYENHPQIKTYYFNQYEQSFFLGYLAGLITTSNMQHANSLKRIGFIAAQEYPMLINEMIPGFIEGARLVDSEIELDRRIVGSWGDPSRASELTAAMIDSGVDVFTAIAGGSSQGMVRTAAERGAYIVWYNTNVYSLSPGIIAGCGMMEQKKLTIEILNDVLADTVQYGTSEILGVKEGYLDFIFDDPGYINTLQEDLRQRFEDFFYAFRDGSL